MRKILIFGNSGSGKSTLATEYATNYKLPLLDLDTLAWEATNPPTRRALKDSASEINAFIDNNPKWVIEGWYSDLLGRVIKHVNEVIFLNPGIETCINNCKNRPWEPHKYESLEQQNQNLEMLICWVEQYPVRSDEFSLRSHQKLFNEFIGKKIEYKSNNRNSET